MIWTQNYDPFGHWFLSTLVAALPVAVLLSALAIFRIKAHFAALIGLAASMIVAVFLFGMPAKLSGITAVYGAVYGFFPIGWIVLNVIFMYDLNCKSGRFKILQESLLGVTQDRRLQLVLIAFAFGAFFEGACGFGTPVAVTAAILIGMGFKPLQASGLSLIANTAPVAFGAIGTPLIALQGVTQLNLLQLSGMTGRILPFFSILVPFWLLWAFCGFEGMIEVWPATLVAGLFFAIPQFLVSNYHGPWLVDVVASVCSMAALTILLLKWHPKRIWGLEGHEADRSARGRHGYSASKVASAWVPWVILSVIVFLWGLPSVKAALDKISIFRIPVSGLHNLIQRVPPVVLKPAAEPAVFILNWITASGTGILVAAILSGFVMGFGPLQMIRQYGKTLYKVRFSLLTISAMMAIGFMTRYSGLDATMGLAFAKTGMLLSLIHI